MEELGFDALWFGEFAGREAFTQAALLLAATSRLTIATALPPSSPDENPDPA